MSIPQIKHLVSILILIFISFHVKAQMWEKEIPSPGNGGKSIVELPNGDLAFSDSSHVKCVDSLGNPQWTVELAAATTGGVRPIGLKLTSSGDIFVAGTNPAAQYFIVYLSPQGLVLNEHMVPSSLSLSDNFVVFPSNESIFLFGDSLLKLSGTGDFIWHKQIPPTAGTGFYMNEIIPTLDGGLVMTGENSIVTFENHLPCMKIDTGGNLEWLRTFVIDTGGVNVGPLVHSNGVSILQGADSNLVISFEVLFSWGPGRYGLLKLSSLGDSLDIFETIPELRTGHLLSSQDGNIFLYQRDMALNGFYVRKLDWQGNTLWTSIWDMLGRDIDVERVIPIVNSGFAVCGHSKSEYSNAILGAYVARTDGNGKPFKNLVFGTAFYDLDTNCVQDSIESSIPSLILEVSGDTTLTFSMDSQGDFLLPLPDGNFQLSLGGLSNYWGLASCAPPLVLSFPGNGDSLETNFPLGPVINCPDMRVDISSGPLAVCFDGSYWVNYTNAGTDSASNAHVEVNLPPSVVPDSATLPFTMLPSGALRFDLGTVPSLASGTFRIDVSVNCPADPLDLLGMTECAVARIYPDSSCLPLSGTWDGSNIEVGIDCLPNDSLRFVVRNTSASAMASAGTYLVLEDNIMRTNNPFQLPGNDSIVFFEAANGATWTLLTDQSQNHPTSEQPLVSLEGCGENSQGQISLGIVPQMPQDDGHPTISIFCTTYVGSYDPNDKNALPEGMGNQNEIETNTELDYVIRFQNEGSYYAREVLVVDTLDPGLDWGSLEFLGGSHDCNWTLEPGGELVVRFPEIYLPWKDFDEVGSQGFFKFKISPKSSLQPGHRIENKAAIYFDFNPPIITNTVVHHIASEMFGTVSVDEGGSEPSFALDVFPNPFQNNVTFRMEKPLGKGASFSMVNITGKMVLSISPGAVTEFEVVPENLEPGLYFFRLDDGKGASVTGKLLRFK